MPKKPANPNAPKTRPTTPGNSKRAQLRKQIHRDGISITKCLSNIGNVEAKLKVDGMSLAPEQVSALKLRADISFRLLAKRLPDLKSVELKNADGEDFVFRVNMTGIGRTAARAVAAAADAEEDFD